MARSFVAIIFVGLLWGSPNPTKASYYQVQNPQTSQSQSAYQIPDTLPVRIFPTEAGEREADENTKERKKKGVLDLWLVILTAALAVFTFLLAIGTGILAYFTLRLVKVTWVLTRFAKRQWESFENAERRATDSSQRELRAYVLIKEIGIENLAELNKLIFNKSITQSSTSKYTLPVQYKIQMENFGQTPADDVITWWGIAIEEKDLPLDTIFPGYPKSLWNRSRSVMAPTVVLTMPVEIPWGVSGEQIVAIRERKKSIYVYGQILYRDAFGVKRVTNFRLNHRRQEGQLTMEHGVGPANAGNDTDDTTYPDASQFSPDYVPKES